MSQLATALAESQFRKKAKVVFKKARKAADSIKDIEVIHRFKAFNQLAAALTKSQFRKKAKVVFKKARKAADSIKSDDSIRGSIALIELVVELERAQFKEKSDTLFREAQKTINSFENKKNMSYSPWILSEFALVLSKYRCFQEAEQILELIKANSLAYTKAFHQLSTYLIKAGEEDKVQCVAQFIEKNDEDILREAPNVYFALLMQNKHYVRALKTRNFDDIDDLLKTLASWQLFCLQNNDFSIVILQDLLRIAGWENPYWKEISSLI